MGVGIVWLMPVQPIGVKERKGTLGSYYAIRDYSAVNPEFGTLGDFRRVVEKTHALGMKLILDWVANHTAWDHPWATAHKDWYKLNAQGQIFPVTFNAGTPQVEYWTDVVALNYANPNLWPAMIEASQGARSNAWGWPWRTRCAAWHSASRWRKSICSSRR